MAGQLDKEAFRRVKEAATLVGRLDVTGDGPLFTPAYRARLKDLVEQAQGQDDPLAALGRVFADLVDGLCCLSYLLASQLAERSDKTTAEIIELYREHSARSAVSGP